MTYKLGRNDPCPCGSQLKYKRCCEGIVNWEDMHRQRDANGVFHLTARGKNLAFLNIIADALQLDTLAGPPFAWREVKRACTITAIRKIHEGAVALWPSEEDLVRVLKQERESQSGLYVGRYDPLTVLRGVTRHSLYSDRILLFDPFLDARTVKAEYNPIERPGRFRMNTLKCLRLWFAMIPWIEAGLVTFIKSPAEMNAGLLHEGLTVQKHKYDSEPAYAAAVDDTADDSANEPDAKEMSDFVFLSKTNEELAAGFLKANPDATQFDIDRFMAHVEMRRDEHPYYIRDLSQSKETSEILGFTTGANYYVAKIAAAAAGAHVITDLPSRWKEVELDRKSGSSTLGQWTPFAKAFHNLELRYLDNVPLDAALRLRRENRLENMRVFLRKTWRSVQSSNEMAEDNIQSLADELHERVREAEGEWNKINVDLVKWFTAEAGVGGTLGGITLSSAISHGQAAFLAGGTIVAGLGMLGSAWWQRHKFEDRYPASFFLELRDRAT